MSLPRYPNYKKTGVPWLEDIPSHWQFHQARRLFEQHRDPSLPGDEQLSATQKYGVIPQRLFMEQEDQKVVLALSGLDNFKRVKPDDFVISLRSFQGGIERSRYAGCVSPAYTVLRPQSGLVPGFWEHLLKSSVYIAALQTTTDGIRDGKNISYGQFGALPVPLPPKDEQAVIAAFLDRETAKIDALIAEQEKLIALLAEKRQATISHAVTRGLTPDAPMKDSGVAWLGDVPAHWDIQSFRRQISRLEQGWSPNAAAEPCVDGAWGVLKVSAVKAGRFSEQENKALLEETLPDASIAISPGDLLVTRANTPDLVGDCCVVPSHANQQLMLSDLIYRLRLLPDSSPEFFCYLLRSDFGRSQIKSDARGSSMTMAKISQSHILAWTVVVPPAHEQIKIVERLSAEEEQLDALDAYARATISLLKERRSALIAAAVTGQIDVRSVAHAEA